MKGKLLCCCNIDFAAGFNMQTSCSPKRAKTSVNIFRPYNLLYWQVTTNCFGRGVYLGKGTLSFYGCFIASGKVRVRATKRRNIWKTEYATLGIKKQKQRRDVLSSIFSRDIFSRVETRELKQFHKAPQHTPAPKLI